MNKEDAKAINDFFDNAYHDEVVIHTNNTVFSFSNTNRHRYEVETIPQGGSSLVISEKTRRDDPNDRKRKITIIKKRMFDLEKIAVIEIADTRV